jgi:hypothetical protein
MGEENKAETKDDIIDTLVIRQGILASDVYRHTLAPE